MKPFAFLIVCFWILIPAGFLYAADSQPQVPGVIIDHIAASSQNYVGSPSLVILPDGQYIASHDLFGPGELRYQTRVFSSKDRGKTWLQIANLQGQFWSTLFYHKNALYIIGTDKENGFTIIRRSDDQGKTWTTPISKKTGILLDDGKYHCSPQPVIVHKGRIWRAMEDTMGPGKWGTYFHAFMMSVPVDSDLLNADQWTFSTRIGRDPSWLEGKFNGWLEGNAVAAPDGGIVDILRVDTVNSETEKAAIIPISEDGKKATFDPQTGFIDFPGGAKKFTIRFDPKSQEYWSLTNWIPPKHKSNTPAQIRNTVALISSPDLRNWKLRSVILYHPETTVHAFQYLDWVFEADDIIAVSRTAFDDNQGGAHNYHDANYMTFHRIADFRNVSMQDSVCNPENLNSVEK